MTQRLRCLSAVLSLVLAFAGGIAIGNEDPPQPPLPMVSSEQSVCESECTALEANCGEVSGTGIWSVGVDYVFMRPHFNQNVAFTRTESDGVNFATITDVEFDYDYSLAPRIWAGYETVDGIGARANYFAFDENSPTLTSNPPANGFGLIDHPPFGGVDISSTIPTESYSARSGLDLYSIDFEVTKRADFGTWLLLASAGVRYASIKQDYFAQLRNGAGALAGQIDFRHSVNGFGPTVAAQTRRPLTDSLGVFGMARGSILFGEGNSILLAGEDLDLLNPFFTTRRTHREGFLPIGEVQVGFDCLTRFTDWGHSTARIALEGQIWDDVGNASSEAGSLGLLGLTVGIGLAR